MEMDWSGCYINEDIFIAIFFFFVEPWSSELLYFTKPTTVIPRYKSCLALTTSFVMQITYLEKFNFSEFQIRDSVSLYT